MTIIQFLLIAAVIGAGMVAVRVLPGERSLALKRIFGLLFVVAAIIAILFPELLTHVAHFLGIGRGTDLLLYAFIVAMLIFAVAVIRAKARSDARVTNLARAVALMEARLAERAERLAEEIDADLEADADPAGPDPDGAASATTTPAGSPPDDVRPGAATDAAPHDQDPRP